MAGGQADVDVPGMRQASVELEQKGREVNASMTQVQGFIATLLGGWSGAAATTYGTAMEPYYELCQSIAQKLGADLALKVRDSADRYQQTHESTVDAASQMANSMPSASGGLSNF